MNIENMVEVFSCNDENYNLPYLNPMHVDLKTVIELKIFLSILPYIPGVYPYQKRNRNSSLK